MSDNPPPLPSKRLDKLFELRRSIIESINSIGRTRGTAAGDDNIVRLTHGEDKDVRRAAIVTALNAVAFCCTDISRDEFMQAAADAWQQKVDEESEDIDAPVTDDGT